MEHDLYEQNIYLFWNKTESRSVEKNEEKIVIMVISIQFERKQK